MAEQNFELMVVDAGDRPAAVRWPTDAETATSDEAVRVGGHELLIIVDGVAVLSEFGLGMEPNDLLDPAHPLIPPPDGSATVATVQRCACGETGCASLQIAIRRDGDDVVWLDATTRGEPYPVGPFRFAATHYEEAVRRAHEQRPWESRAARLARLLSYRFESNPDDRGLMFDWASERPDGAVMVSFTRVQPNPRAGQLRGLLHTNEVTGWSIYGGEPKEIHTQHCGLFPIGDGPDTEAVSDLEATIRNIDPADWADPPAPPRPNRANGRSDPD